MKQLAMDEYGWDLDNYAYDIGILFFMGAVFRAAAVAALVFMNRDKKR